MRPYLPLPATWEAYLQSLSANGRRNVQRSPARLTPGPAAPRGWKVATQATGLEKGKRILIELHHARWAGHKQAGVFRSPPYLRFHDAIMQRLLDRGALELHWLCARDEPVAALYGMNWGGKVYAYQTGRRADLPHNLRPGAVLLALTIRRAIAMGRREFDLLADEAPYKLQLAPRSRPLLMVRATRGSFVEGIRRAARWCIGLAAPAK